MSRYALNLHIQLAWPQWLVNTYAPRVSLEHSIFKTSVIRELKGTWTTREIVRNTEQIAGVRREHSHAGAVAVAPQNSAISVDVPVSNIQSPPDPSTPADETTNAPVIIRPFTRTLVSNRLHAHFAERHVFTPIVFRTSASAPSVLRNVASATSTPISTMATTPYLQDDQVSHSSDTTTRSFQTIERSFHSIVEPATFSRPTVPSFIHRSPSGADEPGLLPGGRSRLFAQAPSMEFAKPSAPASEERVQPQEQSSSHHAPVSVQTARPQLDIARLSDEVYEHIQRKIRVERERRGR